MLMHQIAIFLIVVGIVGLVTARTIAVRQAYKPKHVTQEAPVVPEETKADETWWREIFDAWD